MSRWIPLESNPEVLTRFANALGLGDGMMFCDVFSIDLLDMVPQPAMAVVLLFPLTPSIEAGTMRDMGDATTDSSTYFCKQTIGNACGTIGLIHAVLNNADVLSLDPTKFFATFLEETKAMAPEERAAHLERSREIDSTHAQFASEGQTTAPTADDVVDLHFVCFVEKQGRLWELDGRKNGPVNHGFTSKDTLLQDACNTIRDRFMALDPNEMRFTILALVCDLFQELDVMARH